MWRNYLITGLRALAKNRAYAFINIFGLALGLTACLMILLYVRHETSFDEWIPNSEKIYQLQTEYVPSESDEGRVTQMAPYVAGTALKKDFPQVEKRIYLLSGAPTVIRNGQGFNVENGAMVDGPFFDIFQFPLVHGDPATALRDPGSVVLSKTQARRFFGDDNPVGKTLSMMLDGETVDYRISGVMRDLPKNTHMRIEMLVRFDATSFFADAPDFLTHWDWHQGWTYVMLRPGSSADEIHARMSAWEARNIPDEGLSDAGDRKDFRLVNVADVHLGGASGAMAPTNDRTTIVTFALVAALVLGMACINFINLSTARAGQRAREVALRKVLGASRRDLIVQFLSESILMVSIAMLLAVAAVELLLPYYSGFLDADLSLRYLGGDGLLLPILGLIVIVGAAGGLYPAFYLSGFQPSKILKANKSASDAAGGGRLRNILVVAQFAVSIGLITCTAVVFSQTAHVREVDPGYDREGLLQVDNVGEERIADRSEAFLDQMRRIPGVEAAALTNVGIATTIKLTADVEVTGRPQPVEIGNYSVSAGFFDTMGIDTVAGRLFDAGRAADNSSRASPRDAAADRALAARGMNIVVNESGAKRLGFNDPAAAVGRQVKSELAGEEAGPVPLTIIGVVEDSRFQSAREPIQPTLFRYVPFGQNWLVLRYRYADPLAVRQSVEAVWKDFAPDVPFSARFGDDIISELYDAEEARARTFGAFALLAVLIACLGLFGLASFTTERRTKEIGIRKVLGAKVRHIVQLLAWQFSKPVILANLIAWPVAWWVMRDWLNTFDARINLGPGPFVMAGLLALAIAIATVAGHAFKVARLNPIHALRYE
jgi:putative ABC transport system permease protein